MLKLFLVFASSALTALAARSKSFCNVGSSSSTSNTTITNKLQLKQCLLATYYKNDAPTNTSVAMTTAAPLNLLLVDDHDERINLIFDVKLVWTDERIMWRNLNQSITGKKFSPVSIDAIELLPDEIWLPTIEVVNRLRSRTDFMMQWIHIAAYSNGTTYAHGQFFDDISCKMDAYYYPFDTQQCPLMFAFLYGARPASFPAVYTSDELEFKDEDDESERRKYMTRFGMHRVGEWHMECCGRLEFVPFEQNKLYIVIYTIQLKRSWVQPVMTWIIPPIVISMAGVFSLYFGCKPAEHHSFGASIVITMTLLLTGLYARLPASGTGFPIIGQLYLGLSLSILVSMSLSTLRFDRHSEQQARKGETILINGPRHHQHASAAARRNSYLARGLLKLHLMASSHSSKLSRAQLEYRIKVSCVICTLGFNVVTVAYVFARWLL